jgi:hypothetical protein
MEQSLVKETRAEKTELDEARDLNGAVEQVEADEEKLEIALERDEAGGNVPRWF